MSKKRNVPLYIWIILIIAVAAASIATFYYNKTFSNSIINDHERWGQFGDFFGGVLNPSFSFLSLVALLITITLQSQELRLTRKELEKSSAALKGQEKSLSIQNFDNTFFNLMKMHSEIVESLSSHPEKTTKSTAGIKSFSILIGNISSKYQNAPTTNLKERETAENILAQASVDTGFHADHYYRNLYRVVKFVSNSELDIDKSFYIGILRAQLSPHELIAIFFNGLSVAGEKSKPLIEGYSLFDNIRISLIPKRAALINLYNRKAFGECDIDEYLNSED
jgi:hypothetical protein